MEEGLMRALRDDGQVENYTQASVLALSTVYTTALMNNPIR